MYIHSFFILIWTILSVQGTTKPREWILLNEQSTGYDAAKALCEAYGTSLATITSLEEHNRAYQYCQVNDPNGNGNCWIGYARNDRIPPISGSDPWIWGSGSDSTYTNWAPSEPGQAKCANFWPSQGGQWNGDNCNLNKPVLCDVFVSVDPTQDPTPAPTDIPTNAPTMPSWVPSTSPTIDPTTDPTADPSSDPTKYPTKEPSISPTTANPTSPSYEPTSNPSKYPTAAPSSAPTPTPREWIILFVNDSHANCTVAKARCIAYGSSLATIESAEEQNRAFQYCLDNDPDNNGNCWIGYTRDHKDDAFTWESGSTATYTNWGPGQPDGSKCVNFKPANNGQWTGSPQQYNKPVLCDKILTMDPTLDPTSDPTNDPTSFPTVPTSEPTINPTSDPTIDPTEDPTADPTIDPTTDPTTDPTPAPTDDPTPAPTRNPTKNPTDKPSLSPTPAPTREWILLVNDSNSNWYNANSSCRRYGTALATITNQDEHDRAYQYCQDNDPNNNGNCWIGYYRVDRDPTTPWLWYSGSNATYTNWSPGQPDNEPKCTNFYPAGDGKWTGAPCNLNKPVLCDKLVTMDPTEDPTSDPTNDPTFTMEPSISPTETSVSPTMVPTAYPSSDPTSNPIIDPTVDPTSDPTDVPTSPPSTDPTMDPTSDPTMIPTDIPSLSPTPEPSSAPTPTPREWILLVNDSNANCSTAILLCEAYGTSLATIESAEEQNRAYQYCLDNDPENNGNCWIGYTRDHKDDPFTWESGSTSTYTNWGPGQPDGSKCVNFKPANNGQWTGSPQQYNKPVLCDKIVTKNPTMDPTSTPSIQPTENS